MATDAANIKKLLKNLDEEQERMLMEAIKKSNNVAETMSIYDDAYWDGEPGFIHNSHDKIPIRSQTPEEIEAQRRAQEMWLNHKNKAFAEEQTRLKEIAMREEEERLAKIAAERDANEARPDWGIF